MMKRLIAAGMAALMLTTACGHKVARVTTTDAHHGQRITEDDPRWDCRTMGNHICGAVTP